MATDNAASYTMKVTTMTQASDRNMDSVTSVTTGSMAPIPGERRSETRRPVELAGICEFGTERQRLDCKVVDISNSGAQLTSDHVEEAPEHFRLYILPLNMVMDCRVMWRKDNRMGVYFLAVVEEL